MALVNLGNVVGLLRGLTPPASKPYVLWGKIINIGTPEIVELRYYKGTGDPAIEGNWLPISLSLSKVVKIIPGGTISYPLPASEWSALGQIPNAQVVDTSTGRIVSITPVYNGMTLGNGYTPTDLIFNFGGAIPNDFLLILS